MKKALSLLLAAAMGVSLTAVSLPVSAMAAALPGTPYTQDGAYDVTVPHVVVNQVFGASDDAEVVSHSFIELYNQSEESVSLEGWQLSYRSSADGGDTAWHTLALSGSIEGEGYFLIRCGQVDKVASSAYLIPEGDMEWDVQLHNKGVTVALFSGAVTLTETFAGAVTDTNRPEGYVDALAAQGRQRGGCGRSRLFRSHARRCARTKQQGRDHFGAEDVHRQRGRLHGRCGALH